MKQFRKATVFFLVIASCAGAAVETAPASEQRDVKLQSLRPTEVLGKLDLDRPGLEAVKAAVGQGDRSRALAELLRYYRGKYPPPAKSDAPRETIEAADRVCRHIFQWGPYEPADYGTDIDWTINPADDIEWVAAVYRFYWADDLARAYAATRDDKYARAFVELATDWIGKHPLEDRQRAHPTLTHWKGFAWLDIQTGIRAARAVAAFKAMVHSEAVTPEFLAIFLASMYDHQHKTEAIPLRAVHNKAIFELQGFMAVAATFPEFKESRAWIEGGIMRAREKLLGQVTADGVQREWCGSYHRAVARDAAGFITQAESAGVRVPDDYRQRVRAMYDYLFAVATPDLGFPMFGDTGRPANTSDDRSKWYLAPFLVQGTETFGDPKYAALARLDRSKLPPPTSTAFRDAGTCVFRSDWGLDHVYFALHCPPRGISGHDQPDNGTFELWAYGRWLMTDSGFYTYGHDRTARAWHRQTRVHQTLTLDHKDSQIDGRLALWHVSPELDAAVVENAAYKNLLHRRTVWFVDKKLFVILDEAIGQAPGVLRLHWTPSPGTGRTSDDGTSFTTQYPDSNVLIQTAGPKRMELEAEDGWFAWDYGKRTPRKALSVKHPDAAPAAFLTVLAPYRGTTPPEVEALLADDFAVGGDEARLTVRAFGQRWHIGRNLKKQTAWSDSEDGDRAGASTRPQTDRAAVKLEGPATLGSPDREDEYPAIGCDADGHIWTCWVAFDGKWDAVLASRLDGAGASSPVVLSEASGDHWRPAMCRDGRGRLWATWSRGDEGKWDIWGKFLADGKWSETIRLTRGEGNAFGQKLAVDKAGTLWMAWQSVVDGHYEVLLAPIAPAGAGEAINVSRHPASDWEPAIAATKDGRVCVAWDSYRGGSYDVLVAELKDGRLSEPIGIATSPAYEAHATLAVDRQDRLWVAWDNGGEHWAEDNEEGRTLHSQRSVEIACLDRGQLAEPVEPLTVVLSGPLATFCELPELSVDAGGRLWLFVRHLTDVTPTQRRPNGRRAQDRGIWNPYVLCYDGSGWSQPLPLPDSNGRNDMRVSTCLDADGHVWAAWADDGRKPARAEEPQNHTVHAARISMPGSFGGTLTTRTPVVAAPAPRGRSPQAVSARTLTVGDQKYLLAFGDTHRHTDLSRCAMNHDGSLMDTYRYAIDVAKLDFLAITDHDQDLLKHRYDRAKSPVHHYGWWRSEKYCDIFHIEHKFVPLYAYEHGGSFAQRGGHKNVLYADRGHPCYEIHSPEELFKALEGKQAVAIPHQLADGGAATDWTKWNPEFERVAEVLQARGSYEYKGASPQVRVSRDGHYYRDALAMGVRIGAIASSDHTMLRGAYAGVYCTELSRAGVMEGLRSRRTFGSTDRFAIEFRLGDRVLGEEVEIHSPPAFGVLVDSPKPLRKVQIVKNGKEVHTVTQETPPCRFDYVDRDIQPGGKAWYYVRCERQDDEQGWSSPIWVEWKPAGDN